MQIGPKGIENLSVTAVIYDYDIEKKQLSKDTNPKNHLHIIFCMIHNIPFGIIN